MVLRISAHLQLPAAFRSLSRPSSAPCTKASSCMLFVAYSFDISLYPSLLISSLRSLQKFFTNVLNLYTFVLTSFFYLFYCLLYFVFYLSRLDLFAFTQIFLNFYYAVVNLRIPTKVGKLIRALWWAQMDSDHRPHAYQACALTS